MQTAWRGKSERMKRQEETEAAKKIQAVARGNAARKNYPPPVPTDESSEDEPGAPPTDPYAHELEQKGSRRTGVPTVSGEEHNVRELLLQVCLPTSKPRIRRFGRSVVSVEVYLGP